MTTKVRTMVTALGGLFLLLDQWCKLYARTNQDTTWYLFKPWLGWEYLENPGIAFGIGIPNIIVILLTPLILFGLLVYVNRQTNKTTLFMLGISLIFFGAISNYIDRVLFAVTIDYVRFITSIINIADIIITFGAGLLIVNEYKKGYTD